jgi:hypothetical protein
MRDIDSVFQKSLVTVAGRSAPVKRIIFSIAYPVG